MKVFSKPHRYFKTLSLEQLLQARKVGGIHIPGQGARVRGLTGASSQVNGQPCLFHELPQRLLILEYSYSKIDAWFYQPHTS